jgi:hypothetical protein
MDPNMKIKRWNFVPEDGILFRERNFVPEAEICSGSGNLFQNFVPENKF